MPNTTTSASEESRPRGSGRASYAGALLAVLLALILILFWLLPKDPLVRARLDAWLHAPPASRPAPDWASMRRSDPPAGFEMPNHGVGAAVRAAAGPLRVGCLVVSVGDCASCLSADVEGWERSARRRGLTTVFLTTGKPAAARQFRERFRVAAPFVVDPGGSLSTALNAAWNGRPYLFSRNWRLVWSEPDAAGQRDPFRDPAFQRAVERGADQ
jgi:hypothetical protein